jgi:hypothetical protein
MAILPTRRPRPAVLAALALVARLALAETGDVLCGPESTPDTCVIGNALLPPDGPVLRFARPDVIVRGRLLAEPRCSSEPARPCSKDTDCAPASCLRTATIAFEVGGLLAVELPAEISARSTAVLGEEMGPDGGRIALSAGEVRIEGMLNVRADGLSGVPAGRAGSIAIDASGAVTLTSTARLDASTTRGACGGSITVGSGPTAPETISADGQLLVQGATFGGRIALTARERATAGGTLEASNTNRSLQTRPTCLDGFGGGQVVFTAPRVAFSGVARAQGLTGNGGVIRLTGEDEVTVDSGVGGAALSVTGGDADAITAGGGIFLSASAGDVVVRRGAIEANGESVGLGADAGAFVITAAGAPRCRDSGAPCTGADECAPGEGCVERGGNVRVESPLSAAGGAGKGSGCGGALGFACEIRGTGAVTVSGAVNLTAGRQTGIGGGVEIAAGGPLTVGPGPITADAADGGEIVLVAGERSALAAEAGTLRIVQGTQLSAVASLTDGFGGNLALRGCDVALEPAVRMLTNGGAGGVAGLLDVVAREDLTIGAGASFRALPNGAVTVAYRGEAAIDSSAVFQPVLTAAPDPSLPPCNSCGNGAIDSSEECDGAALGGATCQSLGFTGGTLACAPDCTFDTAGCTSAVCGDGSVGASETCDPGGIGGAPPSFGDRTCASQGFPGGGELTCTPDCAAIVIGPHCSLSVTHPCAGGVTCPAGESCVGGCVECGNGFVDPGEECDDGGANGAPEGACRADCTRAPATCGVCDDGNPCTNDVCDPVEGCRTIALPDGSPCADTEPCNGIESCRGGTCLPGEAPTCDDQDPCTVDGCLFRQGCAHVAVGFDAAQGSIDASLDVSACEGRRLPRTIRQLLRRAATLVARAGEAAKPRQQAQRLKQALRKLRKAERKTRAGGLRGLPPTCVTALHAMVGHALDRVECLAPQGNASRLVLTAPTPRE